VCGLDEESQEGAPTGETPLTDIILRTQQGSFFFSLPHVHTEIQFESKFVV
jgi:hypothetical protein